MFNKIAVAWTVFTGALLLVESIFLLEGLTIQVVRNLFFFFVALPSAVICYITIAAVLGIITMYIVAAITMPILLFDQTITQSVLSIAKLFASKLSDQRIAYLLLFSVALTFSMKGIINNFPSLAETMPPPLLSMYVEFDKMVRFFVSGGVIESLLGGSDSTSEQ